LHARFDRFLWFVHITTTSPRQKKIWIRLHEWKPKTTKACM
jgi:hypothetical protein